MGVVITSTGGVSKCIFTFNRPVDSGLAAWAASYLNERLVGLGLGARMIHQHPADDAGGDREEVSPVVPRHAGFRREPHVRFVDQGGALQGVGAAAAGQLAARNAMELVIDQRHQLVQCAAVSAVPFGEQTGNVHFPRGPTTSMYRRKLGHNQMIHFPAGLRFT